MSNLILPTLSNTTLGTFSSLPQVVKLPQTFYACLGAVSDFQTSTCQPLQSNVPKYNTCMCYYFVNLGTCYLQYPLDPTQQGYYNSTIQGKVSQLCQAAGVDPFSLMTHNPTPSTVVVSTTSSTTTTQTIVAANSTAPAVQDAVTSTAHARIMPDMMFVSTLALGTMVAIAPLFLMQ